MVCGEGTEKTFSLKQFERPSTGLAAKETEFYTYQK